MSGRGRGLIVPPWIGSAPIIDPVSGMPLPGVPLPGIPPVGALPMVPPPVLASVAGTAAAALPLAPGAFQPPMGIPPFAGGVAPYVLSPAMLPLGMPKPPLAPGPPSQMNDPNNDAASWSEHITEDGKKYWFNMKTQVSTFDKPLVLKTPEERAIPPCAWKEYTADGKTYYSNGKDATWTMPEEYRLWKEKIDAVEKKLEDKKKVAAGISVAPPSSAVSSVGTSSTPLAGNVAGQTPSSSSDASNNTTSSNVGSNSVSNTSKSNGSFTNGDVVIGASSNNGNGAGGNSSNSSSNGKKSNPSQQSIPAYASQAEAMEAFKDLLAQKHVSTTAKIKEAQDICQSDPRWDALPTMGEKRQALAEYQTKKLKLEKEQQKQKQRKHKDSFLLMLAENTNIDVKTRWKDAMTMLKDDPRFENVEDSYEREELFNDFIKELEKKEREDRIKRKDQAFNTVRDHLKMMGKEGKITLRTLWQDVRESIMSFTSRSDLRILEEGDCRRCFQEFCRDLMEEFKKDEQKRKDEYQKSIQTQLNDFKTLLYNSVNDGDIIAFTRWKEVMELPRITSSAPYQALYSLIVTNNPNNHSVASSNSSSHTTTVNGHSSNAPTGKDLEKLQGELEFMLRNQFDEVITKVQDNYKADKKLIKRFLHEINYAVAHDTKFEDWKMMMLRFLNMKEEKHPTLVGKTIFTRVAASASAAKELEEGEDIEEGEEIPVAKKNNSSTVAASSSSGAISSSTPADGSASNASTSDQLHELLSLRPFNLKEIFQDLHDKAFDEWEEDQRLKKKNEEKFLNLLKEYFYLSDHVNISWDDAKAIISQRSAYDLLHKSDKKRIFYDYMAQLKEKMDQKSLAMRALSEELEPGECVQVGSGSSYHKKRDRDRSGSYDYNRDRDPKKR